MSNKDVVKDVVVHALKFPFRAVYLFGGDLAFIETRCLHLHLFLGYDKIIIVDDLNCNWFISSSACLMRSLCLRCDWSIFHNSTSIHFHVTHRTTSLLDF